MIHPVVDHCGSAALQSNTHSLAYAIVGCDESNTVGGPWGFPNVNRQIDGQRDGQIDRETETEVSLLRHVSEPLHSNITDCRKLFLSPACEIRSSAPNLVSGCWNCAFTPSAV